MEKGRSWKGEGKVKKRKLGWEKRDHGQKARR